MDNNKDYVLNIRVSKDTLTKLKNKAKENSQSLSDLVRKTLEDSWEIFGDLKEDLFGKGEKNANGVDYYQKIIVAKDVACEKCGAVIWKASEAYLGTAKTGEKKYFCNACFVSA
jgi:formamidopyrimidine-DNA glycosylase